MTPVDNNNIFQTSLQQLAAFLAQQQNQPQTPAFSLDVGANAANRPAASAANPPLAIQPSRYEAPQAANVNLSQQQTSNQPASQPDYGKLIRDRVNAQQTGATPGTVNLGSVDAPGAAPMSALGAGAYSGGGGATVGSTMGAPGGIRGAGAGAIASAVQGIGESISKAGQSIANVRTMPDVIQGGQTPPINQMVPQLFARRDQILRG